MDKHYRTLADQAHRAIAGLSLGGLHTLHISINNPDTFGYVGLFSAQTTNALDNSSINSLQQLGKNWSKLKKNLPFLGGKKLDRKITRLTGGKEGSLEVYANFDEKLKDFYAHSPRLMYIAVGTDDFTKKLNDNLRQKIAKEGYPFVYNESSGGHTWTNWRRYLTDYLPRLFN